VDQTITAAEVTAAIRRSGGYLLADVTLFDLYEGEQIPAGKKSLAYHLTFQSASKTLTDKEVGKVRQRIIDQLSRQLGARLR
jgi:phenylalanyl-tRNA synthetase beta chain